MRYSRQTPLLEKDSSKILKRATVSVIGAGGVGCAILPLLVGAGIGNIRICDGDCVSLSNLHRQTLYSEKDIGKNKALLATAKLSSINSEINIIAHSETLKTEDDVINFISNSDLCIDATDSFSARKMISQACASAGIKDIACAASGWIAQLYLLDEKFKFSDIVSDTTDDIQHLPIFPPAAHLSGVWGASMAIKILTNKELFTSGFFQSYNLENDTFFKANL